MDKKYDCALLDSNEFSDDLLLEILGNRQGVLFVEGTQDKSIDRKLYSRLFPKYALKAAHGAFILYPGTEDEIFYLDEEPSHRDLLYGVGAFKLGPGRKSDFTHIRYYVEKLLKLYRKKEKE